MEMHFSIYSKTTIVGTMLWFDEYEIQKNKGYRFRIYSNRMEDRENIDINVDKKSTPVLVPSKRA